MSDNKIKTGMKIFRTVAKYFIKSDKFNSDSLTKNYCSKVKIETGIENVTLNYLKLGRGKKTLLLFPGALGTIWTSFKPQLANLDRNKFTIIAFDPPGRGFSRPPNKIFDINFHKTDAMYAYQFMKKLNIEKYSILGWRDGGISSMILAAEHPQTVEKLIVWGTTPYILSKDLTVYEKTRDVKKWEKHVREPLMKLYGPTGLQDMWSKICDTMLEIKVKKNGNICMEYLDKIKCPTLILHGGWNTAVTPEHSHYLNIHIKNSELVVFHKGKDDLHVKYPEQFNSTVTDFLLKETG